MAVTQHGSIKFAAVNIAATGSLVAAVANKCIVVVGFRASLAGTTPSVTFRSGASTAISGVILPTSGSILALQGTRLEPLFSTAKGESLDVVLAGAGVSLQGFIAYFLTEGDN